MKRRAFLGALASAAAWSATAARAVLADEARKVHRMAVCTPFSAAALSDPLRTAFFAELRRLGYVETDNLIIDRYVADGKSDRYPQIVRDVLQSNPDVIVVFLSHELTLQFGRATGSIPIVASMGDPVAAGIVKNLARPEANITGVAADAGIEMQGKHLEILKEAIPSASRVAYLSPRAQWEGAWGQAAVEAGRAMGISILGIPMEASAEEAQYRLAFETMARERADALMVNGFGTNQTYQQLIAELALKYRLPSIYWLPNAVDMGGLMVYAPDYPLLMRSMADQVDQVLKGTKPGDIPINQPTKFSFAINLKTAQALGLALPATLLAQADRVIE
jgi:putative tryptophan/tyrosine transport system substrate-binding protein